MCGIAGYVVPGEGAQAGREVIRAMNAAQFSRGPDAEGVFSEGRVSLGHRRLSIIDVAAGMQPMSSRDGSLVIVFNGEIYNYRELRRELVQAGHSFDTESDTEVLLKSWEYWREDCPSRLRGMFAFAVYDQGLNTISLVRDRLGIKPLMYTKLKDGAFAFGSELKSLLAVPDIDIQYSVDAIHDYLQLGYVPEDQCILKGIHKLPAGSLLTLDLDHNKQQISEYWEFPVRTSGKVVSTSRSSCVEELRERVRDAVDVRMVADVPLGAFLSGGLDSSAIVATMADIVAPDPVVASSIKFNHEGFDESEYARAVATRCGANLYVDEVAPFGLAAVDSVAEIYDEPFADVSAIPTIRVCQNTRRHVVVALSGDGADEIFAGYRRYKLHLGEQKVRDAIPSSLRKHFFGTIGAHYPKLDRAPQWLRAKSTLRSLGMSAARAYCSSVSISEPDSIDKLWSNDVKQDRGGYCASRLFEALAAKVETDEPFGLIQYIDAKTWLPGDILTKVDRASMASSLEVRVPFLDHHLVEWASTVPMNYLIDELGGKSLLKSAAEPWLPAEVVHRKKMGFTFPIDDWLRGAMRELLLNENAVRELVGSGLFNKDALEKLFYAHVSGVQNHGRLIWALLVLDRCMKRLNSYRR